jgi:tetratricopeptide (TPR) repeat protein
MLRTFSVAVFAWLFSAVAQPAYGQYRQLIDESVRLYGQGRFAEAIETAERALKSAEETLGPEHPDVATSLSNLALVLRGQDKLAEAEKKLRLLTRDLALKDTDFKFNADGAPALIGFMGMYTMLSVLFLFLVYREIEHGPEEETR